MLDNVTATDTSSVIAATMTDDSAESSAAQAAEESAASQDQVAASETEDDVSRLDREFKESIDNILKPKDEESVEQPVEQQATEEVQEIVEPDPLADSGPRTLEALKQQFPRVATTALEEIARVDKALYETQEKLNALGGEIGVGIANEVMPLLLKANPTEEDGDRLMDHLFVTNPSLGIEASKLLLEKAFTEDEIDPETNLPIKIATANAMIARHIDPDYDLEKVEQLIKFDKAGLIDKEDLAKALEFEGESETVKELRKQVADLQSIKQREEADKERAAQVEVRKHYEKATEFVADRVMKQLVPIAEAGGWTATKEELNSDKPEVRQLAESKVKMGEMLTAWMNERLRTHPEWAAVEHLGKSKSAFNDDGNPTSIFTVNANSLTNRVLADFKEMMRVLNPTFAKSFSSSRRPKETIQKRPVSEIPQTKKVVDKPVTAIDRLDAEYDAAMQQARAQAGY